jgi:serine protease DegQ
MESSARALTFADAAKKAMPAVVNIYSSKTVRSRNPVLDDSLMRRYFPDFAERMPSRRATNLGSGVIVSPEGYVLTNHHVVEGADDIEVVLSDGRQLRARIRGSDPESDLAVLKAEGENLPAITFGTPETVQVGDVVLAIGNPFGFGNTVTFGIVSALGRNHLGINRFEDFIRPTPRSIPATRAARSSTRRATWSASTARSIRRPAARWASASRYPFRSRGTC